MFQMTLYLTQRILSIWQIVLGYLSFSVGWKVIKEEERQKYRRRDGQCYKYEYQPVLL